MGDGCLDPVGRFARDGLEVELADAGAEDEVGALDAVGGLLTVAP